MAFKKAVYLMLQTTSDSSRDEMLTQIAAIRAGFDQVGKALLEHLLDTVFNMVLKQGEAIRGLKAALDRFV